MTDGEKTGGNIYDLGYRRYEGERLGRSYAFWSLVFHSFRGIFGIGRSGWSKVLSMGIAAIAFVPALIQLAIAALSPADIDVFRPEDYFNIIQIVLALFCALVAPELIGRDQRTATLPLYFSRALSRADYVSAKLTAIFAALLLLVVLPQTLMFIGNSASASDSLDYLKDNAGDGPPILASSALVAAFMGSLALMLASFASRRAVATVVVAASFIFLTLLGGILADASEGGAFFLISPFHVLYGATYWIFDARFEPESELYDTGLAGWHYVLAAMAATAAALTYLYRRYLRLAV